MLSKKGTVELNIVIFALVFMTITNFLVGLVDSSMIQDVDTTSIEETILDHPIFGFSFEFFGFQLAIGAFLFNVSSFYFSLFGISPFTLAGLPSLLVSIITLINVGSIFAGIMYLVHRIWIG